MTLELDPTQTLPDEETQSSTQRSKSEIRVSLSAQLNIPGDNRFVKLGNGSNLDRAVRDAVHNLFTDKRLRGKRASTILPAKITLMSDMFDDKEND